MFLSKRSNGICYLRWINGTKRQAVGCRTTHKPEALRSVEKSNGKPYTTVYVSHIFKQAIRDLGLPEELHLHSTRHTFAGLLVQSGVPIYSVSKLLGHASVQMTQVNAYLQPETLHSNIERLQLNQ